MWRERCPRIGHIPFGQESGLVGMWRCHVPDEGAISIVSKLRAMLRHPDEQVAADWLTTHCRSRMAGGMMEGDQFAEPMR